VGDSYQNGARAAFAASGGTSTTETINATASIAAPFSRSTPGSPPAWARQMQQQQSLSHGVSTTVHAIRSGDAQGPGHAVNLTESE
jgi:type IV secretion system protein TrbL